MPADIRTPTMTMAYFVMVILRLSRHARSRVYPRDRQVMCARRAGPDLRARLCPPYVDSRSNRQRMSALARCVDSPRSIGAVRRVIGLDTAYSIPSSAVFGSEERSFYLRSG